MNDKVIIYSRAFRVVEVPLAVDNAEEGFVELQRDGNAVAAAVDIQSVDVGVSHLLHLALPGTSSRDLHETGDVAVVVAFRAREGQLLRRHVDLLGELLLARLGIVLPADGVRELGASPTGLLPHHDLFLFMLVDDLVRDDLLPRNRLPPLHHHLRVPRLPERFRGPVFLAGLRRRLILSRFPSGGALPELLQRVYLIYFIGAS